MIKKIEIENYKSIDKLSFEIGQFNVFIGENGCGKSNLLEAIAFASCSDDISNGKLSLKGIRISEPQYYRSGFDREYILKDIILKFYEEEDNTLLYSFSNSNEPYSIWKRDLKINNDTYFEKIKEQLLNDKISKLKKSGRYFKDDVDEGIVINGDFNEWMVENIIPTQEDANLIAKIYTQVFIKFSLFNFIIYGPENHFLRTYNIDTPYAEPLGNKGEGLLKLIKVIKKEKPEHYREIIENLHLIDWFEDIDIRDDDLAGAEFKLTDKYLEEGIGGFDIKNANEGFFLLLFYITLFVSDYTPSFFAIDNIDTALNPKLCTKLIEILAVLAKKHNKQVLITTHNPSILDGINLNDDEQRLFAVSRNKTGYTRVTRIEKKPPVEGEKSLKLSEQFLRGYIGGIPKNF